MEYLEGEPLADYCARTGATIAQRIALFLAVCDAVEHAHRNLIFHRDLKAGNILVDRTGTPKLLDFGIAKALEEDGSTEQTVLAGRAMTPQAASPEQIRGEALTTASDVYALGLLLYELLAGKPAYLVPANSPADLQRLVCDTVPPKPSALADPETARTLRGDLEQYHSESAGAKIRCAAISGLPNLPRTCAGIWKACRSRRGREARDIAHANLFRGIAARSPWLRWC